MENRVRFQKPGSITPLSYDSTDTGMNFSPTTPLLLQRTPDSSAPIHIVAYFRLTVSVFQCFARGGKEMSTDRGE